MKLRIVDGNDGPYARIELDDGRVVLCRPEDACEMMNRLEPRKDVPVKIIFHKLDDARNGDTDLCVTLFNDNAVGFSDFHDMYHRCIISQKDLPNLINALQRAYELGHDNITEVKNEA